MAFLTEAVIFNQPLPSYIICCYKQQGQEALNDSQARSLSVRNLQLRMFTAPSAGGHHLQQPHQGLLIVASISPNCMTIFTCAGEQSAT
jgi:hypothetical protein